MKLLVTYYGSGLDGRNADVTFPLEAESVQQAKAQFRQAAQQAASAGRTSFCLWGRHHYTHNFVRTVSKKQFDFMAVKAKKLRKPVPESFSIPGAQAGTDQTVFVSKVPSITELDAWLDSEKKKKRALRWVGAGVDFVCFSDELWEREIVLDAIATDNGMLVTPQTGAPVVLQRDWDYWIEGYQDSLLIYAKGCSMGITETETGYRVCTTGCDAIA